MKKQAQVVMLESSKDATLKSIIFYPVTEMLKICDKDTLKFINDKDFKLTEKHCYPVELYILSDDKIEEGDWFILNNCNPIKCVMPDFPKASDTKKIIATTDSELKQNLEYINGGKCGEVCLTQIPQQFIELFITNFNQRNIITEVEVEYEDDKRNPIADDGTDKRFYHYWNKWQPNLIINQDNTINISLPVKKMYSREEVENYISLAWATCSAITYKEGESIQKDCESWISTHLK